MPTILTIWYLVSNGIVIIFVTWLLPPVPPISLTFLSREADGHVEGGSSVEHATHILDLGGVPSADVLVEVLQAFEEATPETTLQTPSFNLPLMVLHMSVLYSVENHRCDNPPFVALLFNMSPRCKARSLVTTCVYNSGLFLEGLK